LIGELLKAVLDFVVVGKMQARAKDSEEISWKSTLLTFRLNCLQATVQTLTIQPTPCTKIITAKAHKRPNVCSRDFHHVMADSKQRGLL